MVVVGSLGLASNILGLFLFQEHGHSHGSSVPASSPPSIRSLGGDVTPTQKLHNHSHARSSSRSRSDSYSSLYGHPAATRASLVQTAQEIAHARSPSPPTHRSSTARARISSDHVDTRSVSLATPEPFTNSPTENTTLLPNHETRSDSPESSGPSHGHSHAGSMNMRALLLHVLGDALGNVGVIATGLIIWLSTWSFKYYFDPIISLVITVIIFSSALPLGEYYVYYYTSRSYHSKAIEIVRSASFILLQGVPPSISLDEVRSSILDVEGVLSLHELHVWQLSESKIVASVHVLASRKHDFMPVASKIREALRESPLASIIIYNPHPQCVYTDHHGIHSSTIQPEYSPSSGQV